ncbi:MAG: lipopolysaccharide heptosyltransferase family protein [Nonlabens sp.]|nr:lipopolysaccharide heptosyltransferase family protein [Nonlabens sp.]
MRILIIQYQMLGDVLVSSILLEPLKKHFPKAQIDYLIDSPALQVMQGNPFVDNYIIPKTTFKKSTLAVLKLAYKLKSHEYDVIIDVYGKLRSNIITAFSSAPIKISWKKSILSTKTSYIVERISEPQHGQSLAIENRLRLLEPLGIKAIDEIENISPRIYLEETEISEARELLVDGGIKMDRPVLMISILGSSSRKSYPLDYMATLLEALVDWNPNYQLLFNYLPGQKEEAFTLYNLLSTKTQENIFFDIYAQNLRSFLAITSLCQAVIGNEGGAINMGKALNIKSFVIFAPYLKKRNWFGINELGHTAVHLADFIPFNEQDYDAANENFKEYYRKFTPEMILPTLKKFQSEF